QHTPLHSFPTRRSSDLQHPLVYKRLAEPCERVPHPETNIRKRPRHSICRRSPQLPELWKFDVSRWRVERGSSPLPALVRRQENQDRKSTRLNSSHVAIS